MELLTISVAAREAAGEPYTLVEIVGEADVTNSDELRRLLDDEVTEMRQAWRGAPVTNGSTLSPAPVDIPLLFGGKDGKALSRLTHEKD